MVGNFYINTVGSVSASKLSQALELGKVLADESRAAGSVRAGVGTIMTGNTA